MKTAAAAKSPKIHPADALDRAAVLTATSFAAFFRRGPNDKIHRPAETLALAISHAQNIAAEVKADGYKGKVTPLIYAIQASGAQSPVAADIIEAVTAGKTIEEAVGSNVVKLDEARAAKAEKAPAKKAKPKAAAKAKTAEKAPAKAAKKAPAKKPAAAPKAAQAPVAGAPKALGKRAALEAAAAAGTLPPVPDFSADTHARFRGKLEQVVALVKAGDVKGLEGFAINPVSSSPKAIARYRDLAVIALKAKAAKAAAK